MKQLLILSGKGGTGKTTVAGAFIELSKARAYADCDVDAPNLHLIISPEGKSQESEYYGLKKAEIDYNFCRNCGACFWYCRFGAVTFDKRYVIDTFACEGCAVCAYVCPAKAIIMKDSAAGEMLLYTAEKVFSTAKLRTGSGSSGKVVTEVKKRMNKATEGAGLAVIDGSPGIGCPVIASLSGADMALLVSEPSLSGLSDLMRIVKTAAIFGTPVSVCVNKYDINPDITESIVTFCRENALDFAGRIPYDPEVMSLINSGKPITSTDCPASRAIKDVYGHVINLIENN